MASDSSTAPQTDRERRIARRIRHIGYAICGSIVLVLAIFLTYSVVTDINSGDVRDPFTHQLYKAPAKDAAVP